MSGKEGDRLRVGEEWKRGDGWKDGQVAIFEYDRAFATGDLAVCDARRRRW